MSAAVRQQTITAAAPTYLRALHTSTGKFTNNSPSAWQQHFKQTGVVRHFATQLSDETAIRKKTQEFQDFFVEAREEVSNEHHSTEILHVQSGYSFANTAHTKAVMFAVRTCCGHHNYQIIAPSAVRVVIATQIAYAQESKETTYFNDEAMAAQVLSPIKLAVCVHHFPIACVVAVL
jgi:hypothetical protein